MSQPANTEQAPPKINKLKLILLVLAVLLVIGGGAGGFFYYRSASASAAEKTAGKSDKAHGKSKKSADDEDEAKNADAADEHAEGDKSDDKSNAKSADKSDAKASDKNSKTASAKELLSASLPEDSDVKKIVEMQPFIVNLTDTEQARYLRLTVSLGIGESSGGGEESKPDPLFVTRVRNAILAVLSVKKSDEILTIEGKTKLRKELLKAARAASEHPQVEAIYITDLIVQM